jgi:hypothetical protein
LGNGIGSSNGRFQPLGALREEISALLRERQVSAGRMQRDPTVRDGGLNRRAAFLIAAARISKLPVDDLDAQPPSAAPNATIPRIRILLIPRPTSIQAQPEVEGNGNRAATNQAGPLARNCQISKSGSGRRKGARIDSLLVCLTAVQFDIRDLAEQQAWMLDEREGAAISLSESFAASIKNIWQAQS